MELSILGFRIVKQFLEGLLFLWLIFIFWKGYAAVFFVVEHNLPFPQRLSGGSRLDNEKIFRWRTALPENRNGHQVSLLAAPAFIEHYFWCCFYFPDL
jgi:hypothetical protein